MFVPGSNYKNRCLNEIISFCLSQAILFSKTIESLPLKLFLAKLILGLFKQFFRSVHQFQPNVTMGGCVGGGEEMMW